MLLMRDAVSTVMVYQAKEVIFKLVKWFALSYWWSHTIDNYFTDQNWLWVMISLECPISGCGYRTPETSEVVACALLAAHTPDHTAPSLMSDVGPANGPK